MCNGPTTRNKKFIKQSFRASERWDTASQLPMSRALNFQFVVIYLVIFYDYEIEQQYNEL